MSDPISAAMHAARIRAWLARCATLPPPPDPIAPYHRYDPVRHEADVVAALARGTSSLEEYRTMPRITLQTAHLIAEPTRVQCVACEMLGDRAHPAYPVCTRCAAHPDETRQRLDQRIAMIYARVEASASESQAARDALNETDAAKWAKIAAVRLAVGRTGRHEGTATPEQRAWLAKVQKALDNPASNQVSDAIRLVALADEAHYWITAWSVDMERRARLALVQFEDCVETLMEGRNANSLR